MTLNLFPPAHINLCISSGIATQAKHHSLWEYYRDTQLHLLTSIIDSSESQLELEDKKLEKFVRI